MMKIVAVISVQNLKKSFNNKLILKDINFEIIEGKCCALLGKNGSGKSTLINCLINLIKIDEGSIKINGLSHNDNRSQIKRMIGVVSENNPLIHELRGFQYLEFVGLLHGMKKWELEKRAQSITNYFFEDQAVLKDNIAGYSTGMKKKLSICAAMMHRPKILILDEPFSGLDLFAANKVIKFLKSYLGQGNTIFIASHDLNYVQKMASQIIVLNDKKIVFNDSQEFFTLNGSEIISDALYNLLDTVDGDEINDLNWIKP